VPDTVAAEESQYAEVVAVGNGLRFGNGVRREIGLQAGDRIVTVKYCGTPVTIEGEDLHIIGRGRCAGGDRVTQLVIPMAGAGERFANAGYKDPKPLIHVDGVPMIQRVIRNIEAFTAGTVGHPILVTTAAIADAAPRLRALGVVVETEPTRGALETLLQAQSLVDLDAPLIVANCDQLVYMPRLWAPESSVSVVTFDSTSPSHSYVITEPLAEPAHHADRGEEVHLAPCRGRPLPVPLRAGLLPGGEGNDREG
jgi:molybdopterin-guanine dinucleotide biosynthesis protein A